MKKVLFALCAILWSTVVLAQVQARSNGFVVTVKGVVVKVEFYTPNIVRVSKTLESGNVNLRKSLAVVLEPTQVEVNVSRQNDMVKASSSLLEVILDLNTGRVQFSNLDGSKLLTEKDYGVQLMPLQYVQRIREKKVNLMLLVRLYLLKVLQDKILPVWIEERCGLLLRILMKCRNHLFWTRMRLFTDWANSRLAR